MSLFSINNLICTNLDEQVHSYSAHSNICLYSKLIERLNSFIYFGYIFSFSDGVDIPNKIHLT